MKEFDYQIDRQIFTGLRRFPYNQRTSGWPTECHNLAPAEGGLELHEAVIDMNAAVDFGGDGSESAPTQTRTITIDVTDFVSAADVTTANVYLDDVLEGTTDANGQITISDVTVGAHALKITKTGYTDSDLDDLLNDFIMVI